MIGRSLRQKINKETFELVNTWDQIDIIGIHRIFHPTTCNTFFSAAHAMFSKIDHVLGCKESVNKFKKIEITPHIISDLLGRCWWEGQIEAKLQSKQALSRLYWERALRRDSPSPKNRAGEVALEKWQPSFYILGEVKSLRYYGASG
jgi:hypothetical protein